MGRGILQQFCGPCGVNANCVKEGGVLGAEGLGLKGLRKGTGGNNGLDCAGFAGARENLGKIRGMARCVVVNAIVHLIS